MLQKGEYNAENTLLFSCLKIINKIHGKGKDLKQIFDLWDMDKNGWCK